MKDRYKLVIGIQSKKLKRMRCNHKERIWVDDEFDTGFVDVEACIGSEVVCRHAR